MVSEPATQMSPQQVKHLIDEGTAYIVDVREPAEFAAAHIAGATPMPLSSFDPGDVSPPDGKHLVLHCRSGQRCGMATEILRSAGYAGPIARMTGGLLAWAEAGLPTVTGDET